MKKELLQNILRPYLLGENGGADPEEEGLQNILHPYLLGENGGADIEEEGWLGLGTEAEM